MKRLIAPLLCFLLAFGISIGQQTPSQILSAGAGYYRLSPNDLQVAQLTLLSQLVYGQVVSPTVILSNAAPFYRLSPQDLQVAQTYLLSQVQSSLTNGSYVPLLAVESNAVALGTLLTADTNAIQFLNVPAISDDAAFYTITNSNWYWNSSKAAYTNADHAGYGVSSNFTIGSIGAWIITNSAHHDTNVGTLDILAYGDGNAFYYDGTTVNRAAWVNDQFVAIGGSVPYMRSVYVTNTSHYGIHYGDGSPLNLGANNITNAVPSAVRALQSWTYVQDLFSISGSASLDNHKMVTPTIARIPNNQGTNFAIYYGSYDSANTGRLWAAFGNFNQGFQRYATAVLTNTPNTFDQGHIGGARVYYENGTNFVFYFGGTNLSETAPEFIGLAWTTDGTNFTKYASNPILKTNAANPLLDSGTLFTMDVIKEGSTYYGFYNAQSLQSSVQPGQGYERIFLATATALSGPWTRYGNSIFQDPNPATPNVNSFTSPGSADITSDFSVFKITDGLWGALYWVGSFIGGDVYAKVAYSYDLTNWASAGFITNSVTGNVVASATGPFAFYQNGLQALITTNDATLRLFRKNEQSDAFSASSLNYSWWPNQDTSDNYWIGAVQPGFLTATDSIAFNARTNVWSLQSPLLVNAILFPTNYNAASFVPIPGYVKIVSSNGVLWKVTAASTNLFINTP